MRRIFKLLVLVCAINFVTARHVRRDVVDDNDDEDTVKKVAVEDEKSDETTDTVSDKSDKDVRNFVQSLFSIFNLKLKICKHSIELVHSEENEERNKS